MLWLEKDSIPKKFFSNFKKANANPMKIYKDFMSSVWVKGNNNEIKEYSEHILR